MVFNDIKYAARMLVEGPGFSLVNALLLRPLPVEDPGSLILVATTDQRNPGNLPLSHLNFKDLRSQNASFTGMAAITGNQVNYSHGQESEQIPYRSYRRTSFRCSVRRQLSPRAAPPASTRAWL